MVLGFEQIKDLLPQRFPFLMVDRIKAYEEGRQIVSVKNITGNEQFFQGHFPERAVMPGSLIIEAMAQTAIIYFRLSQQDQDEYFFPFLFGSVKARFMEPVIPGDVLEIRLPPIKIVSTGGIMKGSAMVEGRVVTKAELSFSAQGNRKKDE